MVDSREPWLPADLPEGLEGVIDSDHVDVAGYSWEGFYSLALSGVRIDPDYYLPVLIIQATEDSPYQPTEAAFIFENLGTPEKFMVSFIGKSHMMVFVPGQAKRMNHFTTAYFGYYLQGKSEYRD